MTTLCRAYTTERDARAAVGRLLAAGLDEAAADADVRALHEGRVLVLVQTGAVDGDAARRALDAPVAG